MLTNRQISRSSRWITVQFEFVMILFYVNKVVVKARIDQSLTDETETFQFSAVNALLTVGTHKTHIGDIFSPWHLDT